MLAEEEGALREEVRYNNLAQALHVESKKHQLAVVRPTVAPVVVSRGNAWNL